MIPNLISIQERASVISQIKQSQENLERKALSLKQFEIQSDRLEQYVLEYLRKGFSEQTVQESPVISSINIQKRVVDEQSTVYRKAPTRIFQDMASDDQAATMEQIYEDARANVKLHAANKIYKYQDQATAMVVPVRGKLTQRALHKHHYDVIPDPSDPEGMPYAYIVSVFDKEEYLYDRGEKRHSATGHAPKSESTIGAVQSEQAVDIATENDYKKSLERYIVWTRTYEGTPALNFTMDGLGRVIHNGKARKTIKLADILSPLNGQKKELPFVDIARNKDFEFFVRSGNSITNFTIQFNGMLSDLANNVRMNGYAIGVLKGPSSLKPDTQVLGANMFMFLPTDDAIAADAVDFTYTSPNSSIGEIGDSLDKFLNYFLSSVGSDGSVINSSGATQNFSSATERLFAMLEKFEATQEDFEVFDRAEDELFQVYAAWSNILTGTDSLDKKYHTGLIPDDANVRVEYEKPEVVKTDSERLDQIIKEKDEGFESNITAIMKYKGMDREEAVAHKAEIDADDAIELPTFGPSTISVEE